MANRISEYEYELSPHHFHYNRLQNHIRETIPRIKITSIRQINNKYLSLAFTIRKEEMRRRNGGTSTIEEFMHATGGMKVASIIKGNLNWRLVTRSKYGQGISFSRSASYANKYCNNRNGWCRAFIFCDVLVGESRCVYDNYDTHPPKEIDSYQNSKGYVLVKFDDFTFNPKFVVYYEEGGYDVNSHLYNDIYSRQYDYDNSFMLDQEWNREQRVLLKHILRIPLKNEDFLNAIVAESNSCTLTIVQPRPMKLPNQSPVMPKDPVQIEVDAGMVVTPMDSERIAVDAKQPVTKDSQLIEIDAERPELPFVEDHEGIRQIILPKANIEATYQSTVSNIVREEADSTNGTYTRGTAPSNQACEKYCLILLLLVAVVCVGMIYTKVKRFSLN